MYLSKIFLIIPSARIKKIPFVVLAMIIGAAFEVLGLGLVIPLLDIISGSNNAIIELLKRMLPTASGQNLILFSVLIFAVVFILKGLYLSFLAWVIGNFTYAVKADVSNDLMKVYLNSPYEFHLKNNSSQLIRNLTIESNQLASYALSPLLIIITEGVVILGVSIFLIVIEPLGTFLAIGILTVFSFIFQKMLGGYTSKLGEIRQSADGMMIQKSQEALGGIKDVIVLGMIKKFFDQFRLNNEASASATAKSYVLAQLPRLYLETIGVLVFTVLLLLQILKGEDFREVVPTLGVFALAAFRLLPSANRVLTSLNNLRFADKVIASLSEQITASVTTEPSKINIESRNCFNFFKDSIRLDKLSYKYPGAQELSLTDISLVINKGESIGFVGKSGAGKSTLSDMILGLLKPRSGNIYLDEVNIYKDIKSWQSLIGYVQQDTFLLDESIQRNIAFGESEDEIDSMKLKSAVTEAQLSDFVSSLPDGLNTQLGERGVRLSGGQKQRIGIARALYRNTPILVFDEATSALDNETEAEIVSAIKSLKGIRTVIVIAHRLSTIEHCERVIELHNGKIKSVKQQTER